MLNADDSWVLLLSLEEVFGANLYSYCENDPVMKTDPSGYKSNTRSKYDANKALAYAKKYCEKPNKAYKAHKASPQCANFLSQCLYAGGLSKMTMKWYHIQITQVTGRDKWGNITSMGQVGITMSKTWQTVRLLREWIKDGKNGFVKETITITKKEDIYKKLKGKNVENGKAVIFFKTVGDGVFSHCALTGISNLSDSSFKINSSDSSSVKAQKEKNQKNKANLWFYANTRDRDGGDEEEYGLRDFFSEKNFNKGSVEIVILK